jgi:hypothetical protein
MLSGLAAEITTIKTLDLTDNDFGDEGMSIIADGNPCPLFCSSLQSGSDPSS